MYIYHIWIYYYIWYIPIIYIYFTKMGIFPSLRRGFFLEKSWYFSINCWYYPIVFHNYIFYIMVLSSFPQLKKRDIIPLFLYSAAGFLFREVPSNQIIPLGYYILSYRIPHRLYHPSIRGILNHNPHLFRP